ncbi:MAG: helix-turn-helix domain-containing protein [Acidimicrobiia bacterium]
MSRDTSTLPDFFTVEEAARVLRIGRGAAYTLARQWRQTGGQEGLPVIALGKTLRVPRAALEKLCGGPLALPHRHPEPEAAPIASQSRARRPRLQQDGLPLKS